jgi:hypothetical protein
MNKPNNELNTEMMKYRWNGSYWIIVQGNDDWESWEIFTKDKDHPSSVLQLRDGYFEELLEGTKPRNLDSYGIMRMYPIWDLVDSYHTVSSPFLR